VTPEIGTRRRALFDRVEAGKRERRGAVDLPRTFSLRQPPTARCLDRDRVQSVPALRRLLVAWKLKAPHSKPTDLVIGTAEGKPVAERNLRRALDSAKKRAKLDATEDRLSWHALRHSFASMLATDLALPATTLAELIGHADAGFTLRCTRVTAATRPRSSETCSPGRAGRESAREASQRLGHRFASYRPAGVTGGVYRLENDFTPASLIRDGIRSPRGLQSAF
jgi:Phage integrase family